VIVIYRGQTRGEKTYLQKERALQKAVLRGIGIAIFLSSIASKEVIRRDVESIRAIAELGTYPEYDN